MRLLGLFSAICASALALSSSDNQEDVIISLQPISSNPPEPIHLASVALDPSQREAEITAYQSPDLSDLLSIDLSHKAKYLRVGIYDASTATWKSSTSLTSTKTFAKGYSPTFIFNVDNDGEIISIGVKSHKIDAGQTRDFGPKVAVGKMKPAPRPYLNRPVVLIEGKVEEPVAEKSFLQKYWWILLAGLMLILSAGGDAE